MIFKNWINTVFGSTGALTGSDIPYDGTDSLNAKVDQVEGDINVKASQAEVDAGVEDTKFVTSKSLEDKPKVAGGSALISTHALTGLSLLDLPHDVSWDAYDYLDFNIIDFETSSSSIVAWSCFENSAPSTWLTYIGVLEAWSMSPFSFPSGVQSQLYQSITNFSKRKQGEGRYASSIANLVNYSATRQGGTAYNYSGTTLATATGVLNWAGWDTGTTKFTDHTLRLICGVGTFTTGTLEIRGRYL
jgi:hypothetical protein